MAIVYERREVLEDPIYFSRSNSDTINNPPELRFGYSVPDCSQLQKRTIYALERGQPIFIYRKDQHGDFFLDWFARREAINRLRESVGVSLPDPNFISYKLDRVFSPDELDLSREVVMSQAREAYVYPFNYYNLAYHSTRLALGLEGGGIDDIRPVPRLVRTDRGALSNLSLEQVRDKGNEIRVRSSKRIIINQSGSKGDKRFSDKQILDVACHTMEAFPGAEVIVMTDKGFALESMDNLKTGKAQVIAPTNINDICAEFFAADHVIATDSFWKWLAAASIAERPDRAGSLKWGDLISLYTRYHTARWGVNGEVPVLSPALSRIKLGDPSNRKGKVTSDEYQDLMYGNIITFDWGIHDSEIVRVNETVTRIATLAA